MIKLNIGGGIFETNIETLSKADFFKNLFADCGIPTDIIFINRSSKLFTHVLVFLIDEKYPYPKKYFRELDYYLISYDKNKLYDPNEILIDIIFDLENKLHEYDDKHISFNEKIINVMGPTICNLCNKVSVQVCPDHYNQCQYAHDQYNCNELEIGKKYCKYHSWNE